MKILIHSVLVSALALVGCSNGSEGLRESGSEFKVVNLPHTVVKWQSIGNCWLYAALGWAESMRLRHAGEVLDLSESYLMYRFLEEQLQSRWIKEIETGGHFSTASSLIQRYGVMKEGDFIPSEATKTKSDIQAQALDYLNQSLKTGLLSKPMQRTSRNIQLELNTAFRVEMDALSDKIINARDIMVARNGDREVSLSAELNKLRQVNWPWETKPADIQNAHIRSHSDLGPAQRNLLRNVKRAMNSGYPVVMNWFVDFNALDTKGIFSLDKLESYRPGRQGYHSTVMEDYVVKGIHPETGEEFILGEGEVSDEEKQLAVEHGFIEYFVVKNSWGGSERRDRTSYLRDGEGGYHRLNASYLFSFLPQINETTKRASRLADVISSFIVPNEFAN